MHSDPSQVLPQYLPALLKKRKACESGDWLLLPEIKNANQKSSVAYAAIWFAWANFPKHATVQFVALCAMLFSMTTWGWLVGGAVEAVTSSGFVPYEIRTTVISTLLIVTQIACGAVLLLNDLSIKRRYFKLLELRMRRIRLNPTEYDDFDRSRARDILLVSDLMSSGVSMAFATAALIFGGGFFYFEFGLAGFAGVISIVFAVFVSSWIAYKSAAIAMPLIQSGEDRLQLVSRWLKSGRSLLAWGSAGSLLKELQTAAAVESKLMNKDSLLRAAEGYVEVFAIAIPLIAAGIVAWFSHNLMVGSIAYAWAIMPFIGVVIGLSRHFAHCSQMAHTFESLERGTSPKAPLPDSADSQICVDESWCLFDGTISQNVDPETTFPAVVQDLLNRFRLETESCTSAFDVNGDGANLSAGQRMRVLLARAFLQAKQHNAPLLVTDSLSALDDDALQRVKTFADHFGIDVEWHAESLARISRFQPAPIPSSSSFHERGTVKIDQTEADANIPAKRSPRGTISELWFRSRAIALTFLMAAAGIFCLPQIATLDMGIPVYWTTAILALIGIGSFFTACGVNYSIECQLRKAAVRSHASSLCQVGQLESRDHFQRLSRDYQTVAGRLTWYVSDISWIFSMTALAFASVVWGFGWIGLALVGAFLLTVTGIWKTSAGAVVLARQATTTGVNDFLIATENLKRLSGLPGTIAEKLQVQFLSLGLKRLADTQVNSQKKKTLLAYSISTLTALTLIVASACAMNSRQGSDAIFILTALIAFTGSSTQLILAMVGFMAQQHSYVRLEEHHIAAKPVSHIEFKDDAFRINPFTNDVQNIRYRESVWSAGSLTTLIGASGLGKTQFLSRIASFAFFESTEGSVKPLYFSRDTSQHLGTDADSDWETRLLEIIDRHAKSKRVCVLFDETTSALEEEHAMRLIARAFDVVSTHGGMMIVVDHRLSVGTSVQLQTLIESSSVVASPSI